MKKIFLSIAALAIAILTVPAHAELSVTTTVDRIMPWGSGNIDVILGTNPGTCTNSFNPKRFRLQVSTAYGVTDEGLKNIYASLLLAASLGKTGQVFFDETPSTCNITRVYVFM